MVLIVFSLLQHVSKYRKYLELIEGNLQPKIGAKYKYKKKYWVQVSFET